MSRLRRLLFRIRCHPFRFLTLSIVLSLAIGAGVWTAIRFYVDYHLHEAERAMNRYDFETAEQHLAECLRFRANSGDLHLQMARAARRAEHYEQAKEHLRLCRQQMGRNPDNSLEGILFQAQVGDIADVEKLLQEQVDLDSPDTNLILEAMSGGYIQTYRLDAAMHCLNLLLGRDPDNVVALLARASLWKTAGNHVKAEEDCLRAVEAQPEHRAARLRFGEILLLTKQPEEALRHYEYLQLRFGDDSEVLLGLARSHRQLGHAETALRLLENVLAHNPHEGFALVERGKIALEIESAAAAEKWLRQAVADYPFDSQVNYLLAQALQRQGKHEEARPYEAERTRIEEDWKALEAAFHRVVQNPRDPEPRLQAGRICLRNGRADAGERWLLSAVEQVPEHAATRAALAEFYERNGKTELAARYRRPLDDRLSLPTHLAIPPR